MARLLWLLEGGAIPALIMICGLFFLIFLRGQPFRSPRKMFAAMTKPTTKNGVSPFRALTLALAGTLGVGNIVGVANAIWIGGAGAIFWMWISAFAAMILKYAEILLAVRHRREKRNGEHYGGAYYYIQDLCEENGWKKVGKTLSCIFAVLLIVDALSMGCIIQVNAISSAAKGVFHFSPLACGILLSIIALPLIARGAKGVSSFTEYLVPIMSVGYIILSLAVLWIRKDALPTAMGSIFREAFSFRSMGGGLAGFLTSRALRVGTMRGLLSNEGGSGTAPTAHACAETHSPAAQGIWGIFEVFVDTILLCTATALVILVNYADVSFYGENAVMMTIKAYSNALGGWSEWFFLVAVICFGFATVICWASYGEAAMHFLTKNKVWRRVYLFCFSACILIGATISPAKVFTYSDIAIAALTTINLLILILGRKEIAEETKTFLRDSP